MSKAIFFWVGVFLGIIALLVLLAKFGEKATAPTSPPIAEINIIKNSDWVKGDRQSKTILVGYSDFQCPACRAIIPTEQEILQSYGDKLAFVYRHFPIYTIHANATLAGQAAEAAGKQGKFWEYHDILFEKQPEWEDLKDAAPKCIEYASLLSLDANRFESDMNSDDAKQRVLGDAQEAAGY